ncbi:hypothetical protein GQ457_06G038500 [Hibiscus cannabinus]
MVRQPCDFENYTSLCTVAFIRKAAICILVELFETTSYAFHEILPYMFMFAIGSLGLEILIHVYSFFSKLFRSSIPISPSMMSE